MTAEYAEFDERIVDYEPFTLSERVIDPATAKPLRLRGPAPRTLDRGTYFSCLGAAQTFGRFCALPYPALLAQALGLDALNLGRGGAGPRFFIDSSAPLLDYVNRGAFAVVQVMSARSESNSLFASKGLGHYTRRSDGSPIGCDAAYQELIGARDERVLRAIVAETRREYTASCRRLLEMIEVPTVLFWFSTRQPDYSERYDDLNGLFGEFPQLVNGAVLDDLRVVADASVECVSRSGVPQQLLDRRTGKPAGVHDPWGGVWRMNWYYPTPQMHAEAAARLRAPCEALPRRHGRRRIVRRFWRRLLQ